MGKLYDRSAVACGILTILIIFSSVGYGIYYGIANYEPKVYNKTDNGNTYCPDYPNKIINAFVEKIWTNPITGTYCDGIHKIEGRIQFHGFAMAKGGCKMSCPYNSPNSYYYYVVMNCPFFFNGLTYKLDDENSTTCQNPQQNLTMKFEWSNKGMGTTIQIWSIRVLNGTFDADTIISENVKNNKTIDWLTFLAKKSGLEIAKANNTGKKIEPLHFHYSQFEDYDNSPWEDNCQIPDFCGDKQK